MTMNKTKAVWYAIVGVIALLAGIVVGANLSPASAKDKPNDPLSYAGGPHQAVCYRHEGNSDHAKITNNGKSVVLKPYGDSWPGDHWETLVVKGGNARTVTQHPTVGTPYSAPENNGGNVPDVSHYIVCKGTTPEVSESPSPEPTPSVTPTDEPVEVDFTVTVMPPTCTADGYLDPYQFPITGEGYILSLLVSPEGPGTYTVVANALPGFVIDGPNRAEVTVEGKLTDPVLCPVDSTPTPSITPEPSPEPTPSVTPEPSPEPTVTPEPETPDAPKPSPARGVPTYTG